MITLSISRGDDVLVIISSRGWFGLVSALFHMFFKDPACFCGGIIDVRLCGDRFLYRFLEVEASIFYGSIPRSRYPDPDAVSHTSFICPSTFSSLTLMSLLSRLGKEVERLLWRLRDLLRDREGIFILAVVKFCIERCCLPPDMSFIIWGALRTLDMLISESCRIKFPATELDEPFWLSKKLPSEDNEFWRRLSARAAEVRSSCSVRVSSPSFAARGGCRMGRTNPPHCDIGNSFVDPRIFTLNLMAALSP